MLHFFKFYFQTINKITDAIKYGIQSKYDGVRDSTRQLKMKLLVRAMEDLDELHEDKYGSSHPSSFIFVPTIRSYLLTSYRSITTYNTLLSLSQAYTSYSQRSLDALNEAHRVGAESQKGLKELIREHDRMAKEHARRVVSVKGLPGGVAKWGVK